MPSYADQMRNKILKALFDFYKGSRKNSVIAKFVTEIESALFREAGDNYGQLARQRVLLLKSKQLPHIKEDLLNGLLTVEDFVTKKADEFESEEIKQKRIEQQQWAMDSMQSDFYKKNLQLKEGEFTCFRCKSRKIWQMQRQMRSADEPMTTFCECSECGQKWKVN